MVLTTVILWGLSFITSTKARNATPQHRALLHCGSLLCPGLPAGLWGLVWVLVHCTGVSQLCLHHTQTVGGGWRVERGGRLRTGKWIWEHGGKTEPVWKSQEGSTEMSWAVCGQGLYLGSSG